MKADQYSKFGAIKVKARANYQCQACGSDNMVQAHAPGGNHSDWRTGVCLCAHCHSQEHPTVPRNLFFTAKQQPYWTNISARAIAEELKCHNRTVIRAARDLGIAQGTSLSARNKERLTKRITKPQPEPLKSAIRQIERIQTRNENIKKYRDRGMTYRALGRMFKLSPTHVMNIVRNHENANA